MSKWAGCIPILNDKLKNEIEKICRDINARDPSFHFRIYTSFISDYPYLLVIYGDDKNQTWRRLIWLKHKTVLKDYDTPMWVKPR